MDGWGTDEYEVVDRLKAVAGVLLVEPVTRRRTRSAFGVRSTEAKEGEVENVS